MEAQPTGSVPESERTIRYSATYELFVLIVTLFSFWVLALLLFWPVSEAERELLQYFDLIACAILFVDFVVTTYRSPNSDRYFIRGGGWLDLLGCAPAIPGLPWIGLLRLARLRRVVQTARDLRPHGLRAVRAELRAHRARGLLLVTLFVSLLLIAIAALIVLQVETTRASAPNIVRGSDALWWAFATVTTVGYGDRVPTTDVGRLVAIGLMTAGIGVYGVLTSFISHWLLGDEEEMPGAQERTLEESLQGLISLNDNLVEVREELAAAKRELTGIRAVLQARDHRSDGPRSSRREENQDDKAGV